MRVLGLVHQYIPERCAGAESHIHAMLRALAIRGHDVDVVLSRQVGQPYELDGVRVWPMVDLKQDALRFLSSADVIVSHLDNTTRATVLGHFNQIPVCIVHHNTFEQSREAIALAYSRTDLVAVNSYHMHEGLVDWAIDHRIQLPPRVICRPTASIAEYRTTPGPYVTLINLRRRDINSTSRDGLSKGGELFRTLAERMPQTEFLGVTGIYGVQQSLSGLRNARTIPHVPHHRMRELVYSATRILLVPSSYESWGRVASEAMCSGIPVIASPTPGLQEQLGCAGTLVDPEDVDGWIEAINRLNDDQQYWVESSLAYDRARELEELGRQDLDRWCDAVEATARVGGRAYDSIGVPAA